MQTKMPKVPITKATSIDYFDFQVDTFCKTVAIPTVEVVQNTFLPVVERFDFSFESNETACFYSSDPDPQSSFGSLTIGNAIEKVTEFLFQLVVKVFNSGEADNTQVSVSTSLVLR
jgi:hypothetical protein